MYIFLDDVEESNDISIDRSDDYYSSTIDKSDKVRLNILKISHIRNTY